MEPETYRAGSFTLIVLHAPLLNTPQIAELSERLPGIKLPEMIHGAARVMMVDYEACFAYEFNAMDALRYCGFNTRRENLYTEGVLKSDHILYVPSEVQVCMAEKWKGRTLPKDSIFKEEGKEEMAAIEVAHLYQSDWTYSTPYRGLLKGLPTPDGFAPLPLHVVVGLTDEPIPLDKLGPENPAIWGAAIDFFEDELDDSGQSKCYIRIRAMKDCWYALLRSYVRVDGVLVRILDTRIYHEFGKKEIRREFRVMESNFEELQRAGFVRSPQWANDQRQDDLVFKHLQSRATFKDVITYE